MSNPQETGPRQYKYDVALSFLKRDIELARQIYEGLRGRLEVFYFPDRQTELVSKDGEKEMTEVFLSDSRLDVILYRQGWGETPWTRVEERAIRTRSFQKEDYEEFLIVLVVDENQPPDWLPPHIIYGDPLRYGLPSVITTIENVLKVLGVEVPVETAAQRAERLDRTLEWEKTKKRFLESKGIVQKAHEHAQAIFDSLVSKAQMISEQSRHLHLDVNRLSGQYGGAELSTPASGQLPFVLDVSWWCTYSNSLKDARITACLLLGLPRRPNRIAMREPKELAKRIFEFDLSAPDLIGWTDKASGDFFPGISLAEELLSWYLQTLEENIF